MGLPIINPFHWGYRGTVKHILSEDTKTVSLKRKDGTKIQLHQFVNELVPGLKDNAHFYLNPYAFTGILQSMQLSKVDSDIRDSFFYGREIVRYSDGGASSADWAMLEWKDRYGMVGSSYNKELFAEDAERTHPADWPRLQHRTRYLSDEEVIQVHGEEKPLVVVAHGVAGGSHEPVIRSMVNSLLHATKGEFHVVVLNSRGCARTKVTNKKLYTAFSTDDIREFINEQHKKFPNRKIYTIGFSFGATTVANYLGQEGSKAPVAGTVFLCNPWDMYASAQKIDQNFWSRNIFSRALAGFLVRLVKVNMKEVEYNPDDELPEKPSPEKPSNHVFTKENLKIAHSFTTSKQFDDLFTAPCIGFESAYEYYDSAGSVHRLSKITVPSLIINSLDDPVVDVTASVYEKAKTNENVLFCTTDLGGHLAFLDSSNRSWVTPKIADFIYKLHTLTDGKAN